MEQFQLNEEHTASYIDSFLKGFLPKVDENLSMQLTDAIANDRSVNQFLDQLKEFEIAGKFLNLTFMKILFSDSGISWLRKHYKEIVLWLRSNWYYQEVK